MKRLMTTVLIVCIGLGSAAVVSSHEHKGEKCEKMGNPEKRVKKMAKKLDLTEDQQQQVLRILETGKEQIKSVREASNEQIKQLLNEEQSDSFAKILEKRQHKFNKRHKDCDKD